MRKKWLMLAESVKCKFISLRCFHWYALHDGNFHKPCKVFVGFRLIFLFVCSMPKFSKIKVIGTTDARVACSFLFWLAIFQLTSAKFQTFAYNSRVVWSGYMKFWPSLRLMNCMFVSNFVAIGHVTLVLEPVKFGVKSGLSQKWPKYGIKYFIWLYVLRYPFIPTNPLFGRDEFFSFIFLLFLFFFLNFVRSSKPQNTKI